MTTRTWRSSARRAALGGILGLGVAAGPAEAVTLIQMCPYTITVPDLYVLARDLPCPPGDGITIAADNVRLFLNGRTLAGTGGGGVSAQGTAANPTLTGLRIEGPGTVRGFSDGVELNNAPGARVVALTATGNGDDGIEVANSPGAEIVNNTAAGNAFGVIVFQCEGCRFAGNRVDGNRVDGFRTITTPRSRLTSNVVTGSGFVGMQLLDCAGCEVTGNQVEGSGAQGIRVLGDTTGARIAGNTAAGNGEAGIDLVGSGVDGNLVQGNVATGNRAGGGIRVTAGATGNRLEGNRATGNAPVDLVDENLPACVNTWRGNRFATDNETGAAFGPGAGCIR